MTQSFQWQIQLQKDFQKGSTKTVKTSAKTSSAVFFPGPKTMLFSLVKTNSGAFDELGAVYLRRWRSRSLNFGWDRDHMKTGSWSTSMQNLVQVVCSLKKKTNHHILWQMIRDFHLNWENKLPSCCACDLLQKAIIPSISISKRMRKSFCNHGDMPQASSEVRVNPTCLWPVETPCQISVSHYSEINL